jgi:hypothetical protein
MLDEFDAVTASLEHHKLLFEDDRVRVLETLIRPGEETALHTHVWSGHLYIISWSDCLRYDAGRNVLMDSRHVASPPVPGTIIPASALALHSLHNVGTRNIHVIMTEFKDL